MRISSMSQTRQMQSSQMQSGHVPFGASQTNYTNLLKKKRDTLMSELEKAGINEWDYLNGHGIGIMDMGEPVGKSNLGIVLHTETDQKRQAFIQQAVSKNILTPDTSYPNNDQYFKFQTVRVKIETVGQIVLH